MTASDVSGVRRRPSSLLAAALRAEHPYRTPTRPPEPPRGRRWRVRGLPFSPALIAPTLAVAALRLLADDWTPGTHRTVAFAAVALVAWLAVFVRRGPPPPPASSAPGAPALPLSVRPAPRSCP